MIPGVMDHLNRLIRSLEKHTRILKKLLFIRYRYDGDSVETAAGRIGITIYVGAGFSLSFLKPGPLMDLYAVEYGLVFFFCPAPSDTRNT